MEATLLKKATPQYVSTDSIMSREELAFHRLSDKIHRDAIKNFHADTQSTERACMELTRKTIDRFDSLQK